MDKTTEADAMRSRGTLSIPIAEILSRVAALLPSAWVMTEALFWISRAAMALPMAPIPITAISDLELIASFACVRSRPNEATVGPMLINQSSSIYGAQFSICKASYVRTHDSIVLDRHQLLPKLSTKMVVHRRQLSPLKIGDGRRIDFPYSYRAGWEAGSGGKINEPSC
jgi:hypothetical protein